jgi:putative Holliday junction resolvase
VSGSLLGVDLGDRRVGLALADADTRLARPFKTVRRGATVADDVAVLRRICDEQRVTALVVGLPIEASGIEGPMAAAAREWAAAVGEALGLPVTLRDERLSSFVAERRVGPMPRGRSGGPPTRTQREAHRERIDREAAAVILQDELDATPADSPAHAPQVSA